MDKTYDVIVVGSGMGGLTTAAYTTRANRKVLLLEKSSQPGGLFGSFQSGGYVFDHGARAVENSGIYNLQWSGQFQNTDNQIQDISVWLRKGSTGNGTDIVGSSGLISIPARKSASLGEEAHNIIGWNYFLELQANEFVELWWSATLNTVSLQFYAAGTTPTRPTTASVIATLSFVSALPA